MAKPFPNTVTKLHSADRSVAAQRGQEEIEAQERQSQTIVEQVLDLDLREVAGRRALATAVAAETEYELALTLQSVVAHARAIATQVQIDGGTADEARLHRAAMVVQRLTGSFVALAASNGASIDDLRMVAERLGQTSGTSEAELNDAIETYLAAKARQRRPVREILAQAHDRPAR